MPFPEAAGKAGCWFSSNFFQVAIPPFGFTDGSPEVFPLFSAFPFSPSERDTEPGCPRRVSVKGAPVGVGKGCSHVGIGAWLCSSVFLSLGTAVKTDFHTQ